MTDYPFVCPPILGTIIITRYSLFDKNARMVPPHRFASFVSPPNAATVRIVPITSSATFPAFAYDLSSSLVSFVLTCGGSDVCLTAVMHWAHIPTCDSVLLHAGYYTGCRIAKRDNCGASTILRKYYISFWANIWRIIQIVYTIYTTKIEEFVCPPNISETVAVRIMKLAHRSRIASTVINFKTNCTVHLINLIKKN